MAVDSTIVSLDDIRRQLEGETRRETNPKGTSTVARDRAVVSAQVRETIDTLDADLYESVEGVEDPAHEREERAHLARSITELEKRLATTDLFKTLVDQFIALVTQTLDKKELSGVTGDFGKPGVYRIGLMNEIRSSLVLSVVAHQTGKKSARDAAVTRVSDTHMYRSVQSAAYRADLDSKIAFIDMLSSYFINLSSNSLLILYRLCLADESLKAGVTDFFAACDPIKVGKLDERGESYLQDNPEYQKLMRWKVEFERMSQLRASK